MLVKKLTIKQGTFYKHKREHVHRAHAHAQVGPATIWILATTYNSSASKI